MTTPLTSFPPTLPLASSPDRQPILFLFHLTRSRRPNSYCSFITLVIAGEIAIGGYAVAKKEGFGQLGADLVNSGFNQPGSRPLFDLICRRRVSSPALISIF